MPAILSKLHVRFIQTQQHFSLKCKASGLNERLPSNQLYIKNNSHFYFANLSGDLQDGSSIELAFTEANDYLTSLQCRCDIKVIAKGSDEYEEALLFFHQDASTINQVLLLYVEATDEK